MITGSIFSKIVNYTKHFTKTVLSTPQNIKNYFNYLISNIQNIIYSLKHFGPTNIELGKYHLNNQNYNDAIFRFKMVEKFYLPNNPEINYLLGLTYFLKRNYKKAILHLQNSENHDKINLLQFIKNIDTIKEVPDEIYNLHRSITSGSFIQKFAAKNDEDLPKTLITTLISDIEDLPTQYSILELGNNICILGAEIQKRMSGTFNITGVECSNEMINLQSICFPNLKYDKSINSSISKFLNASNYQTYDVITSLDGFCTRADLTDILQKIYNLLKNNGYFAFAIKTTHNTQFLEEYLEFSYNPAILKQLLETIGFKITTHKQLNLEIKNNYSIFVCTKM